MAQIRQSKDVIFGTAGTPETLTFDIAVLTQSCLVCLVKCDSGTTVTVADNVNGSWPTVLQNLDFHGVGSYKLFALQNSTSGTPTVTATSTGGNISGLVIVEVMGVTASCLQGTNATNWDSPNTIGVDAVNSGSISVSTTPSLLLGLCAVDTQDGPPAVSGTGMTTYTYFWDQGLGSTNSLASRSACLTYQRLTSGSTATANFSTNTFDEAYAFALVLTESTAPTDPGFVSSLTFRNFEGSSANVRVGEMGPAGYCGVAIWESDSTGNTVTPPSGWTQLFHGSITFDGADFYVWYNPSLTGSGSSVWAVNCPFENTFVFAAYSPVDQTTPVADSGETIVNTGVSSPASITAPSVNAARAASRAVWMGIGDPGGGSGIAFTPPSGYTSRIATAGNQWTMLAIADKVVGTGATGTQTGVFTRAGQSMGTNGIQLILNPVAATPGAGPYVPYVLELVEVLMGSDF